MLQVMFDAVLVSTNLFGLMHVSPGIRSKYEASMYVRTYVCMYTDIHTYIRTYMLILLGGFEWHEWHE